jgi:hypothetical protein
VSDVCVVLFPANDRLLGGVGAAGAGAGGGGAGVGGATAVLAAACGKAETAVSGMGGASATGGGGGIRLSSVAAGVAAPAAVCVAVAAVVSAEVAPPLVRNTPRRITRAAAAPPTPKRIVLFDFRGTKSDSLYVLADFACATSAACASGAAP